MYICMNQCVKTDMLDPSNVIELIKSGTSEELRKAVEYSNLVNMHITGKDVEAYTEDLNRFESETQRDLRNVLMKSNKSVFSFLLRPLDKIFTAKGGFISYNVNSSKIEKIKEATSDVSSGLSIKKYLKNIIKPQYIIDPNSIVMVDVDEIGVLESVVYNSKDIFWIDRRGKRVSSIIFQPYKIKGSDKEYYRVVDEVYDVIYVKDGDNVYIDEETIKDNFFKYVPAIILGDIVDPNTGIYSSLVDDVLEEAKEHLRDVSVKTVHKLTQGFAKYWTLPESCTTCGGTGHLKKTVDGDLLEVECHSCNGSGVKIHNHASDTLIVPIPQDDEATLAPHVAGYINPSLEIWDKYNEEVDRIKHEMFRTLWGSAFSTDFKKETATAAFLNIQPETERVSSISTNFSEIHEFILDCFGKAILLDRGYKSEVSYGTRYLLESPDEILKRYRDSRDSGVSVVLKRGLLDKYFQTEYSNNDLEYQKTKKILAVEPFPELSELEVKSLGVSEEDLKQKIYFPEWLHLLEDSKKTLMTVSELREDLKQFVIDKALILNTGQDD